MARWLLVLGALGGLLSVALGAFGAHALEGAIDPRLLRAYQKGVDYQGFHSLALLVIGVLTLQGLRSRWLGVAAGLFLLGIALFCGSLYAMALTGQRGLGAITPLGGISFIAGWLALALAAGRANGGVRRE